MDDIQEALEDARRQANECLAGWKRTQADFENYRKEEASRLARAKEITEERATEELFPVLDSLARAEASLDPEGGRVAEGFRRIAQQMQRILEARGVREIPSDPGTPFDPGLHEAVGEADGEDSGTVQETLEKGYEKDGRVLRPAKVTVIR